MALKNTCMTAEKEEEEAAVPGPVGLKEGRVVDNSGQQGREGPEQQSREELSDDGVLPNRQTGSEEQSRRGAPERTRRRLTLRYSTGLVTLNLSMVEMMMAGVVRKKSRMKRMQLMMKQRIHHEMPPSDRCSLRRKHNTK